MKSILFLLLTVSIISCGNNHQKREQLKNFQLSALEKLAGGFTFTEGPAVDKQGNVFFTDVREHMIYIWTVDNKLDTFRVNSGRANGLYFDKNQNLLACEGEKGRITSTSPNGNYKTIASLFTGKRFNQPNDLWPDKKGGVYFTDPMYGGDETAIPQDGMHLYYIHPDKNKVSRVIDDFKKPNGVLGTPDGKTLYVTDAEANKTYRYEIQEDGHLTNKKLFIDVGFDGMTLDKSGHLYITPNGKQAVDVYSPSGELLHSIQVPEKPSNVCFGGEKRNELYITARTSIYRIKLNTQGVD